MIRVGCKTAVIMPLTKDLSANENNGTPLVTYGAPKFLPRLQKIELKLNTQSADVDADDSTDTISICSGVDGTVTRDSFSPDELALLLNEKTINGMNGSNINDNPGYFAVGFKSSYSGKNGDNMYLYMLVLKAKFSNSDISAESKGTGKLSPQPDAVTFKSVPRDADGEWRFYTTSSDSNFDSTFFTAANAGTLANAAIQTYGEPAEVVFCDTLPTTGTAMKLYVVGSGTNISTAYWNGSKFIPNGTRPTA